MGGLREAEQSEDDFNLDELHDALDDIALIDEKALQEQSVTTNNTE
jgi:hypothetical protein